MATLSNIISEAALVIGSSFGLSILAKATFVLLAALVAAKVCVRSSASARHLIFVAAFASLLVLPLATIVIPAVPWQVTSTQSTKASAISTVTSGMPPQDRVAATVLPSLDRIRSMPLEAGVLWRAAWLAGVVIFLVPVAVGLWQWRRLRLRGLPWLEGQTLVDHLATERGVRTRVGVLCHEGVPGPLTSGLLKPTLLVPLDAQTWNSEALKRALVHELEHVRRRDWLTHCVARMLCGLYWFHPLAWIAWRQLRLEAERACDDAAIEFDEPTEYASLLIAVAQRGMTHKRQPALAMAARSDLATRVAAVLDSSQQRGRTSRYLVAGTLLSSLVVMAAVSPLIVVTSATQSIAAERRPEFSVASVKPSKSRQSGPYFMPGGRVRAQGVTLKLLMRIAYSHGRMGPMLEGDIIDGPRWIDSELFDIEATVTDGRPADSGPVALLRLQRLLEDRFQLRMHTEIRERPVYDLVVAKPNRQLGARLRRAAVECPAPGGAPPPAPPTSSNACGLRIAAGRMEGRGVELSYLAMTLSGVGPVDRAVHDRTGLAGQFDLDMEWTPVSARAGDSADNAAAPAASLGPSLFTALEEQLGLKLQPGRAPGEVIVIDSVERPKPN